MAFWFALGWFLFFTAASYVFRPRPRVGAPQPSSLGDFQLPTADEGRVIPYIAGSALVQGPNVLWYGDFSTTAIVEDGQTTGYRYYLGLQYGICLGQIDRVLDIRFDREVLTVAPFIIGSSQVLSVYDGVTHFHVTLPAGTYATGSAACQAITAALQAATGNAHVRVVFGYQIVPGWNDRLHISADHSTLITLDELIAIRPGSTNGTQLAQDITFTLRRSWYQSVVAPSITFDTVTGKFAINGHNAKFIASGSTGLATMGFSEEAGVGPVTPFPWTPIEGQPTAENTFYFYVPAGLTIEWTDPATNCHSLFGMEALSPDFTTSSRCDNPRPAASGLTTYNDFVDGTRISIDAPSLFGGLHQEGGIQGVIDVYYGTQTQLPDAYLEGLWGADAPAFRGLCYAVCRKLYQGDSAYMKPISFVVERCPNTLGLTGGKHRIAIGGGALGDDANPACVIYELLTDTRFGMGIPVSMFDVPSFLEAAESLFTEGLGISINVETTADGFELVSDLLRQIDAVLYTAPESGLLTLDLIRADYDVADLLVLDETNVKWVKLTRPAAEDVRNVVKLEYVDRTSNHSQRVYQVQNLANIQILGRLAIEEMPMKAISNPVAAQIVAERLMRVVGSSLGGLEIGALRHAVRLRPGAPFVLNWPKLGVSGLICRVSRISTGEIRDNLVRIDAAEDPYGLDNVTYNAIA